MKEVLYWISLDYATFLIVSLNDEIIEAPPIARWTIGKSTEYVINYFKKKKANIIKLNNYG